MLEKLKTPAKDGELIRFFPIFAQIGWAFKNLHFGKWTQEGGLNGYGSTSEDLVHLIDSLELHDLLLQESSFTFFGSGQIAVRSCLDKFLVSDGARNWFSNIAPSTILQFFSDHIPVLVSFGDLSRGSWPFKFFDVCCQKKNLQHVVANSWMDSFLSNGSLWDKLNLLRGRVSKWQHLKCTSVNLRIKECEEELRALLVSPVSQEDNELTFFRYRQDTFSIELSNLRTIENRCYQQKSRVRWLKERDLNTPFFHMVPFGHCRSNFIALTMLSLPKNEGVDVIRTYVFEAFKWRFSCHDNLHSHDWYVHFASLDSAFVVFLESLFSKEEIFQALMDAEDDNALKPNGILFRFVKSFQQIFKGELVSLFQFFHLSIEFDCSFLESFISLIPKSKSPASLNDFRPVSLLGWVHKLISSVLIARLCVAIPQLVSHSYIVFIYGHSIYDGYIATTKVRNAMKRQREGLILKLDFEKIYDKVD